MIYNKLVRDKIPQIIEDNGQKSVTRILDKEEYMFALEQKLDEEVQEFHRDKSLEELADILEVVYALTEAKGYTREQLTETCDHKRNVRGGFSDRIFLISNEG